MSFLSMIFLNVRCNNYFQTDKSTNLLPLLSCWWHPWGSVSYPLSSFRPSWRPSLSSHQDSPSSAPHPLLRPRLDLLPSPPQRHQTSHDGHAYGNAHQMAPDQRVLLLLLGTTKKEKINWMLLTHWEFQKTFLRWKDTSWRQFICKLVSSKQKFNFIN